MKKKINRKEQLQNKNRENLHQAVMKEFQRLIDEGTFTKDEVDEYLKQKEIKKQKNINRNKYNKPAKIIYGHNTK